MLGIERDSITTSSAKRRKVRKGTTSCWECKRRKVRCEYSKDGKPPCRPCTQRGFACVSQDLPEPASLFFDYGTGKSSPIKKLHVMPTPESANSQSTAIIQSSRFQSNLLWEHEEISRSLHEALPSRGDTERILDASSNPSLLAHEINIIPYNVLQQDGIATRETLLEAPAADTHPVLIAKYMLLLASFIQQLQPDFLRSVEGLSESPRTIMERLVNVSGSLVTTNDDLLGTIEGLECVMVDGLYQMNIGNLRRAWVSVRRALSIAQLMKLNRPASNGQYRLLDQRTRYHPQHMWFRIVFLDRYLCLMLGLPQGCTDSSTASDVMLTADTPMGLLERRQCMVAGRIIQRNENDTCSDDIALTQALDLELQKAAKDLPSKWWLTPKLDASISPETIFWNIRQLFAQMLHFNLVNQLHMPYMLRSMQSGTNFDHSKVACVNASREILSRWTVLRSFNSVACSCRSVDFGGLMAGMTLLLAHLHGQRSRSQTNILAHQYQSDRAMIERVQESMEDLNRLNSDTLSARSADLLSKLLAIDKNTNESEVGVVTVEAGDAEILPTRSNNGPAVSVHIPYFGIIKIASEGMSRHRMRQPNAGRSTLRSQAATNWQTNTSGPEPLLSSMATPSTTLNIQGDSNIRGSQQSEVLPSEAEFTSTTQALEGDMFGDLLQPDQWPSLAAGTDEWTFQGVDQAFLESIMRSNVDESGETIDWGFI